MNVTRDSVFMKPPWLMQPKAALHCNGKVMTGPVTVMQLCNISELPKPRQLLVSPSQNQIPHLYPDFKFTAFWNDPCFQSQLAIPQLQFKSLEKSARVVTFTGNHPRHQIASCFIAVVCFLHFAFRQSFLQPRLDLNSLDSTNWL